MNSTKKKGVNISDIQSKIRAIKKVARETVAKNVSSSPDSPIKEKKEKRKYVRKIQPIAIPSPVEEPSPSPSPSPIKKPKRTYKKKQPIDSNIRTKLEEIKKVARETIYTPDILESPVIKKKKKRKYVRKIQPIVIPSPIEESSPSPI
jgi:F0F1-type ATP synthase delta subunit